ncbi:MAG: 5'/3'-nucleotidase SurE [Gammaproteobacteria bacterium]|nr:5'/3'-nucleotidase SurE [Gammaproteobacteria bacterium]
MKILISNDDGVLAPGLQAIAKAMAQLGQVEVIAPDRNRSGASNSLTLLRPLRVRRLDNQYYSVDGTPTDCVHLALTGYFDQTFDMVVSGINEGANLGDDVLYSGTVAAAIEGGNMGLPAMAVSLASRQSVHYETAATIALQLMQKLQHQPLSSQTILNVNVPDLPLDQIQGIEITRLGTRHGGEQVHQARDPREQPIYWIGQPGQENEAGPGTDFFAIERGFVSVTPLQLDMTHYTIFDQLSSWVSGPALA